MSELFVATTFVRQLFLPLAQGLAASSEAYLHAERHFDAAYIAGLSLPSTEELAPNPTVALVDGENIQRESNAAQLNGSYKSLARTKVHENLQLCQDKWYGLVAAMLGRMVDRRVLCAMYDSRHGDRMLGRHWDDWLSIIVQMHGTKQWWLWPTSN
jgi:hypothetical protein